jgi:hypothetical protein
VGRASAKLRAALTPAHHRCLVTSRSPPDRERRQPEDELTAASTKENHMRYIRKLSAAAGAGCLAAALAGAAVARHSLWRRRDTPFAQD